MLDLVVNKPEWVIKLEQIAQTAAEQNNCELYDLEIVGSGQGRIIRLYIDKAESGIGIEDCTLVTRALNEVLDVEENLVPGDAYQLEVSSPGLDRHLKTLKHFQKVIGQKIYVQLSQSLGALGAQEKSLQLTKKFEDILVNVEGENLYFNLKNESVVVPLKVVEKSRVAFEFQQSQPKKKNNKK